MSQTPPHEPAPESSDQVLSSWKEIAAYLGATDRTVQRWERQDGLPVHRLPFRKRAAVFAYRSEIDEWLRRGRSEQGRIAEPSEESAAFADEEPRRARTLAIAAAAACFVAAVSAWSLWPSGDDVAFGPSEPLLDLPGLQASPALSPDGTRLAFCWRTPEAQDYDVYVVDLAGGEPRRLTQSPDDDLGPSWSPDGETLAFTRHHWSRRRWTGGAMDILLVPAAGGAEKLVASVTEPISFYPWPGPSVAWWPDGSSLVAPDTPGSAGQGLFRFDLDGKRLDQLTAGARGSGGDASPAVSPEADKLAFLRRSAAGSHVYIVDIGGDPKLPTLLAGDIGWATSPRFSPDGGEVWAWMGGADGAKRRLWSLDPRGERPPKVLLEPEGRAFELSIGHSAEGDLEIIYPSAAVRTSLWLLDLTNPDAKPQRIAPSDGLSEYPSFSPDGRLLAFSSDRSGAPALWIAEADGSNSRMLTDQLGDIGGSFAWSPEGDRLLGSARDDMGLHMFLVDAANGESKRITSGPYIYQNPTWPESAAAYVASDVGGGRALLRFDPDALEPEEASPRGALSIRFSPGGEHAVFYMGEGALIAARRGSREGVRVGWVYQPQSFDAARQFFCFLAREHDGSGRATLYRRPFSGGEPQSLLTIERPWRGLAVSPDGARLVYSAVDEESGKLLRSRHGR
ncbi:MAG: hypothetical protein GC160_01850 [Acidobacteria bacterium]|nr:hypothetical protein [Acidobacteriota bacterium]